MIIKSMTASFGALRGARLELKEGLNLIEAPNEAGKSTWSAFLRAMLYGVPTKERDRQGFLAEKNRYQPWSGEAMEGRMDLIWQGRAITLRRSQKGSAPFGKLEAVDAATGEPVEALTGAAPGEVLLGVPREVFERSAFVGQGAHAVDGAPALEKRIAALVSSGEEDVSSSEARQRLRDWLNRRRHNKTGLIPKLEGELGVLEETLERQARAHRMAEEARREVEALTAEKTALEEVLSALRGAERQERLRRYEEAQAALERAREEVRALHAELTRDGAPPAREELRRAQEELNYLNTLKSNARLAEAELEQARDRAALTGQEARDPLFPGLSPDAAWDRASEDAGRAKAARTAAEKTPPAFWLGPLAGLGLGGAAAALCRLTLSLPLPVSLGVGAALLVVLGAAGVLAGRRQRAGREAQAAEVLARYGASCPDDILSRAALYREKWVVAEEAARKLEAVTAALEQTAAQQRETTEALLALVHTFAPTVRDAFGVSAALSRALSLEEKLSAALIRLEGAKTLAESLPRPEAAPPGQAADPEAAAGQDPREVAMRLSAVEQELVRRSSVLSMVRGELNTLGDPALFQARREALLEELERRRAEYDALSMALEALDGADQALQARFSPALNRRSGEIMAALTGGKYDKITLTRDFEAAAEERESVLARRVLSLSRGTADQLYLAVRLAICQLALPGDNPAPLVLDDALTNFDDERMALALDYLLELSKQRQILLFTCHSREGLYLKDRPGVTVRGVSNPL